MNAQFVEQFWQEVQSRTFMQLWWFNFFTWLAAPMTILLLLMALWHLHQQQPGALLSAIALLFALVLLLPGALLGLMSKPEVILGLDPKEITPMMTSATLTEAQIECTKAMFEGVFGCFVLVASMAYMIRASGWRLWRTRGTLVGWLEPPERSYRDESIYISSTSETISAHVTVIRPLDSPELESIVDSTLLIEYDPAQHHVRFNRGGKLKDTATIHKDGRRFLIVDNGVGVAIDGRRIPLATQKLLHNSNRISVGAALLTFSVPDDDETQFYHIPTTSRAFVVWINENDIPRDLIFPITQEATNIGRAEDNDLVLQSATVSRHHAIVTFDGSGYYITPHPDCRIEPLVNGEKVKHRSRLTHGQVITLGDQQLRFELEEMINHARP